MYYKIVMTTKYGLKEIFYLKASSLIEAGEIAEEWQEAEPLKQINQDKESGVYDVD